MAITNWHVPCLQSQSYHHGLSCASIKIAAVKDCKGKWPILVARYSLGNWMYDDDNCRCVFAIASWTMTISRQLWSLHHPRCVLFRFLLRTITNPILALARCHSIATTLWTQLLLLCAQSRHKFRAPLTTSISYLPSESHHGFDSYLDLQAILYQREQDGLNGYIKSNLVSHLARKS